MVKFTLIILVCLLLSCTNRVGKTAINGESNAISLSKDSVSYKLFNVGKGFGFDILVNGKVYIHQPIVPCIEGLQAFAKERDAKTIAELIVYKLSSGNFKFLLQKIELDSLLGQGKMTFQSVDTQNFTHINPGNSNFQRPENLGQLITKTLPLLADGPLKNKWTAKENVPFGLRAGGFCFSIGRFIFIGSGEYRDEIIKDFWCYNTYEDTWTCLAEIPSRCFSGVAFSIFNKGYAGLGTEIGTSSGKFKKHMFQYDPETNTWKKLKDFPGTPRIDASVFVIQNKAYIGTGYDGGNTRDFYAYDPTMDSWKRIADFAGGDLHASVGIGTGKRGFIVAGARAPRDFNFVYEYIPNTNTWERKHDLPSYQRNFLSGNDIDSNCLLAGGGGSYEIDKRLRDFYAYNIDRDSWAKADDYPINSFGSTRAVSGSIDGKIYMGTGDTNYSGNYLNDWNVFEYYYSVRTETGEYNETTSYPLQYNGQWQLFQECSNEDCFAGAELKSSQQLGDFSYSSSYVQDIRSISLNDETVKKLLLFPRNFSIKTDKQPKKPVSLRLFFTKNELEKALSDCNKKTGIINTIDDVQMLQCNETNPDTDPSNNSFQKNTYSFIKPQWYSYGFNGETMVAEFLVTSLHSEFYLTISAR